MPYVCRKVGSKWELTKKNSQKSLGTHPSEESCHKQMRAIYANEISNDGNIRFEGSLYTPWDFEQKVAESKDSVNVLINSQGGDFFEAISIHNKLRDSGKKVVCYVNPFAFSAAAIVALAGDEVYMVENGLLFFHLPKAEVYGTKDAEQLTTLANALKKSEDILVNTIKARTGKTEDEARQIIQNDTWLTADEALASGLIDEIIPIKRDVKIENFFPERIVNFIKEKSDMGMKEVCAKFNLGDEAGETELVSFIEDLQRKSAADTLKEVKVVNEQKIGMTNVPSALVNMVRRSREVELNALVTAGKVTPVVVNELKMQFISDERIISDIQNDNDEEFNKIVNALNKNETVISMRSTTGIQPVPRSDTSPEEAQTLVNEMKNRNSTK